MVILGWAKQDAPFVNFVNKPQNEVRLPVSKPSETVVVFVHGLSGSPASTWGKLTKCIKADPDFSGVALDYYAYPTRLVRLPFTPPLPGLRDLAEGLRTFIEERHGDKSSVSIVAHSLGGLIARHFIVSNMRSANPLRIERLALLAVPSTGSTLANAGSAVSFQHRQLKALSRDEGGLTTLNIDWEHLKIEDSVRVRYILGGADRTVPADSAAPYIGRENKSVIIDADHRSIVAPENCDDLRYMALKRFLTDHSPRPLPRAADTPAPKAAVADPLFDVYTPSNEPYYAERSFDTVLTDVVSKGHVWLTGQSGIGKSAAARRSISENGWRLIHINLSSHQVTNEQSLFKSLCEELISVAEISTEQVLDRSFNDQILWCKRALAALRSDKVTAILVEEMPVGCDQLMEVAETLANVLEIVDADDRLYGHVRFLFSSRISMHGDRSTMKSKIREKIQFLPVDTWTNDNILKLVQLVAPAVHPELTAAEHDHIARESKGSPRFVKMVFRHWRNRTARGASIQQICDRVIKEMVS